MRLLTVLAMAALAAGVYHYRSYRRPARAGVSPRAGASPADAQLEESVLSGIAGAASTPVQVRCVNGVVTLRGSVRPAERDLLLAAALAVPGVTQVTNLLEVDEPVGDLGPMQSGIATGV